MGGKRFEEEGEARLQHYQMGARLYSGGIHVEGVRGGSHSVTTGGQLQERKLPGAPNLEWGSCEYLIWTHLEHVQHCTDLPRQVTFPAHTKQGKMGPGLG